MGCPADCLEDDHLEVQAGDFLAVLDLTGGMLVEAEKAGLYQVLKVAGVKLWFVVYDLLPISSPKMFPPTTPLAFKEWLMSVCRLADGAICISRAVADELTEWVRKFGPTRLCPLKIGWFHLGADITSSAPSLGMPEGNAKVLSNLGARPTFLMVGTIEPRKGHMQTLKAFEKLWEQKMDVNLVIVGKQGWLMEVLIESIQEHSERERRLFWLDGISDEYLEEIYVASACLIASSEGEGFGLPLIEAAQHKLPIIARDIPVFREVAGEHAYYFNGLKPLALADAIKHWLLLKTEGKTPQSDTMPWLTWEESAKELIKVILPDLEK
jgi:glycosyltransferase involved in cell wall biosynthesis